MNTRKLLLPLAACLLLTACGGGSNSPTAPVVPTEPTEPGPGSTLRSSQYSRIMADLASDTQSCHVNGGEAPAPVVPADPSAPIFRVLEGPILVEGGRWRAACDVNGLHEYGGVCGAGQTEAPIRVHEGYATGFGLDYFHFFNIASTTDLSSIFALSPTGDERDESFLIRMTLLASIDEDQNLRTGIQLTPRANWVAFETRFYGGSNQPILAGTTAADWAATNTLAHEFVTEATTYAGSTPRELLSPEVVRAELRNIRESWQAEKAAERQAAVDACVSRAASQAGVEEAQTLAAELAAAQAAQAEAARLAAEALHAEQERIAALNRAEFEAEWVGTWSLLTSDSREGVLTVDASGRITLGGVVVAIVDPTTEVRSVKFGVTLAGQRFNGVITPYGTSRGTWGELTGGAAAKGGTWTAGRSA